MTLNTIFITVLWLIPVVAMLVMGQWGLIKVEPLFISNYTYILEAVTAWIAAVFCFWSSTVFNKLDDNWKAWRYIGFSTILWGIGQLVLTYRDCFYEAMTGTPLTLEISNLVRNISDVFYIISIPILALGFYYLGRTFKTKTPIYGWIIAIVVFIGAMWLSIYNNWNLVFQTDPALVIGTDELIFTILYAILYPLLLSYAVLMVSIILTGILGRPWIFVTLGVIIYSIGEIVWNNIKNYYVAGGYVDLLWIVGFMLVGIGAYINYYMIKHPY